MENKHDWDGPEADEVRAEMMSESLDSCAFWHRNTILRFTHAVFLWNVGDTDWGKEVII